MKLIPHIMPVVKKKLKSFILLFGVKTNLPQGLVISPNAESLTMSLFSSGVAPRIAADAWMPLSDLSSDRMQT